MIDISIDNDLVEAYEAGKIGETRAILIQLCRRTGCDDLASELLHNHISEEKAMAVHLLRSSSKKKDDGDGSDKKDCIRLVRHH